MLRALFQHTDGTSAASLLIGDTPLSQVLPAVDAGRDTLPSLRSQLDRIVTLSQHRDQAAHASADPPASGAPDTGVDAAVPALPEWWATLRWVGGADAAPPHRAATAGAPAAAIGTPWAGGRKCAHPRCGKQYHHACLRQAADVAAVAADRRGPGGSPVVRVADAIASGAFDAWLQHADEVMLASARVVGTLAEGEPASFGVSKFGRNRKLVQHHGSAAEASPMLDHSPGPLAAAAASSAGGHGEDAGPCEMSPELCLAVLRCAAHPAFTKELHALTKPGLDALPAMEGPDAPMPAGMCVLPAGAQAATAGCEAAWLAHGGGSRLRVQPPPLPNVRGRRLRRERVHPPAAARRGGLRRHRRRVQRGGAAGGLLRGAHVWRRPRRCGAERPAAAGAAAAGCSGTHHQALNRAGARGGWRGCRCPPHGIGFRC